MVLDLRDAGLLTIGWLIAARALQGVGGAMVLATSPALLTLSFPASQRGRALGMQATATYLGLALAGAMFALLRGRAR
ncbi:MAG TPA: MFS transporter [Myxococcota bacterium]|nr:MFS transporter [Myxococcota bacterium]